MIEKTVRPYPCNVSRPASARYPIGCAERSRFSAALTMTNETKGPGGTTEYSPALQRWETSTRSPQSRRDGRNIASASALEKSPQPSYDQWQFPLDRYPLHFRRLSRLPQLQAMRHPIRQRPSVLSLTSFKRPRNTYKLGFQLVVRHMNQHIPMSARIEKRKVRRH